MESDYQNGIPTRFNISFFYNDVIKYFIDLVFYIYLGRYSLKLKKSVWVDATEINLPSKELLYYAL